MSAGERHHTTLHTARLVMRRAVAGDLAALHAIFSDPEAMRYWSTPPHADEDVTRDWLAAMIAAPPDRSDDFIVELAGRVIGKLGAWALPEIGFIFDRHIWGRGYATEALAAFVDHVFAGVTDHLVADVDPRNTASIALLTRAGFCETHRAARTWHVAGIWCDSIYLRLDKVRAA